MTGLVELAVGDARARIDRYGAQITRWTTRGRELLWEPQPDVWGAVSPVLFPIVGWARDGEVRVGSETFPMPVHGFASSSLFEVVAQDQASASLELVDSPTTRAIWPFSFALRLDFALSHESIRIAATVTNRGAGPMPYAYGVHPGFRWPFAGGARQDYRICFDECERADIPVITAKGLFSASRRAAPIDGRMLRINDEVFAREALCFLDARSRGVEFVGPGGEAIRVQAEDMPHLALWSRPPAPFLCIESWTGHGDPDGFGGDAFSKPSMRILAAGESARHAVVWSYRQV